MFKLVKPCIFIALCFLLSSHLGVSQNLIRDHKEIRPNTIVNASCPPNCQTTTISISTGYNPATNSYEATGQIDPIWQLTQAPPITNWNVPRPAFVVAVPFTSFSNIWDLNYLYNNQGWISGQPTASYSTNNCGNPFGCPPCTPEIYQFERCFCICASDSVTFDFSYMADDYVQIYLFDYQLGTETLLTGHDCDWNSGAGNVANFSYPTVFYQKKWLNEGRYCLRAKLWNTNGVTMGLNIRGFVTGLYLEKDACCATYGAVSGVRYHDLNCNGMRGAFYNSQIGYEPGLGNGIIQLCDGNQNVVATSTTDATGAYAFFGLAPGVYTVKEISQIGWSQSQPSSGTYTVTINAFGTATGLDFGNCIDSLPEMPCPSERTLGTIVGDTININTGVDDNLNVLPFGSIDPRWMINSNTLPPMQTVDRWNYPAGTSNWISFENNQGSLETNYQVHFTFCTDTCGDYNLKFRMLADNIACVNLDGQPVPSKWWPSGIAIQDCTVSPNDQSPFIPTAGYSIDHIASLQAGVHTLEVDVYNVSSSLTSINIMGKIESKYFCKKVATNNAHLQTNEMRLFPNPATDRISIVLEGLSSQYLNLTDPMGNILRSLAIPENANQLDVPLDGLQPGIYFIICHLDSGQMIRRSFIKI